MSEKPKEVRLSPQLSTLIWRSLYASGQTDIADLLAARMIHDDVNLVPIASDDDVSSEEILLFWKTYLISEGYLEEGGNTNFH
tara:strand:+ start:4138 stop:4386 length:249 start_codon:yes stop_codon:yes gene_type:complete